MTAGPERPDDPPSYPRNRSFGALLAWHVAWGTRAALGTTRRNAPWVPADLASLIHVAGTLPESAKKSFQNWRNAGRLPEPSDADKIERLFSELFGDAPDLRFWRDDLRAALERDRGKSRAERKADAIAFRNEMMGVALAATSQEEPPSTQHATSLRAPASGGAMSEPGNGAYPEGYPRNGTYSELLTWHLRVWGTRPGCSFENSNPPTNLLIFMIAIHGEQWWGTRAQMEKNLGGLLSGESKPNSATKTLIEQQLFGDDPRLDAWKLHMRRAEA